MAGGGVAGVAASLAAARRGYSVTLIESEKDLGGTATLGMTGTICGLYANGGEQAGPLLNRGIIEEVVNGLQNLAHGTQPLKMGRVFVLPYEAADLQALLESLCDAEPGIHRCMSTRVHAVTTSNSMVRKVVARGPDWEQSFNPKVLIDATGAGEVAALSGADFELTPLAGRQLSGIIVCIDHVGQDDALGIKVPFLIAKGIAAGVLPDLFRFTVFTRRSAPGAGLLKINMPDSRTLESGEIVLIATQLVEFLAKELSAFASSVITAIPKRSFSREGRRITGSYRLTAEDILSCRKFPDAVAKGAWPMEIWDPAKGATYSYPQDGDYYEIPFRCIEVKGFSNLLTSGRCISVTHEALGSTRVIGCCIPLGEQAGIAAAKYASTGNFCC